MNSQEKYREILEQYCRLFDYDYTNEENTNLYEYVPKDEYDGIGWLFELGNGYVVYRIPDCIHMFSYRFTHYFTSTEKLQSFFESLT